MRYPVSVLEWWLLVWVLLDTTTLNLCSAACAEPWRGEDGDIRVSKRNAVAAAGRIWVCDQTQWRAVCHDGWDLTDAKVACRQLGFDTEGTMHCINSCFGRTRSYNGFLNVACIGPEVRLIDCTLGRTNSKNCPYAGVVCGNPPQPSPTPPDYPTCTPCNCTQATPPKATPCQATLSEATSCDCPQATPFTEVLTCNTTHMVPNPTEAQLSTPHPAAAIGGALGALAAGLGLALVGVVMGWVWHCRRYRHHKQQYNIQRNISGASLMSNPSYNLPKPHPSIQYSSQGPRDTALNTSPTETSFATYDVVGSPTHTHSHSKGSHAPLQERVYQVVEGPGEGRKEGEGPDYQEEGGGAGLTYEVPIPTATLEQAKKQADTHYSSLQHH